jgi:predicted  nucleic acid-binding Zn-ribbon protein
MAVTAAALRELHHLHQQLTELRDRVERGPKQIRARETNAAQLKAKVDEARARVQATQMAINRKQLDLKAGEQKVVDARVRLNAASSNKEYQALVEQIAAAEMAGSVLADEILESMEKLDAQQLLVKEAEKGLAAGNQELAKIQQSIDASAASLRGDIERLEVSLAQAEAALPADFKIDYQRVVRGKGANGLAAVDDNVCGACGQQITLNMQNELRLAKPVFCKSCGCLLYLSE